ERVDAKCGLRPEPYVVIEREPVQAGAAEGERQIAEVRERGHLADLIDDAAAFSMTEQHRSGTHDDLDALHVERVAIVVAEIAHPVEIEVVLRVETANREAV